MSERIQYLTQRRRVEATLLQYMLCQLRLHDWCRWERLSVTLGYGKRERDTLINARECINCGLSQIKELMP